ncbi:dihydrofolate reductase family protein [Pseudonocardia adelaidensis]|uniref:Dihydrofolate reductase family protein n=1 Tax=Pseudonocardia adelaidensis TaxID=648754 RepID=A0ABP9NNY0_9PSEU
MSKLVVQMYLSLDGVMQAPGAADDDRDGGFTHGGWMAPHVDKAMSRDIVELHAQAAGLLRGRRMYETMARYFPHLTDDENPAASAMNRVSKYVASRTLTAVNWQNSTLLPGEVGSEIARLKEQRGDEIQVLGSGQLVQTLMRHDLVDEYRLWIFPVLLGSGKRLFAGGTMPAPLALVGTKVTATGVVIHTYERVRSRLST